MTRATLTRTPNLDHIERWTVLDPDQPFTVCAACVDLNWLSTEPERGYYEDCYDNAVRPEPNTGPTVGCLVCGDEC